MDNVTSSPQNCSNYSLNESGECPSGGNETLANSQSGLLAFGFILIFCLFLEIVFLLLTLIPLIGTNALPRSLRSFLSSQLLGGILVALAGFVIGIVGLALVFQSQRNGNLLLCTFLTFFYGVGAIVRMWSMAAYSVAVLLIIVYSRIKIKLIPVIVVIIAIWIISGVMNMYVFFPEVYAVHYVGGTACFPDYDSIPVGARYGFAGIWMIAGGIVPLCISIVIPIICLCYLKRHNLSEGSVYNKAMARFALFLVIGNFINLLGQAITAVAAFYANGNEFYIAYTLVVVSLIPTPILILIFLKAVRQKMADFLSCGQLGSKQKVDELKKSLSSTPSSKETQTRLYSLS